MLARALRGAALARPMASALRTPPPQLAALAAPARQMAMGPAKGGEISDELLEKLGSLSTQGLIDGLWVMGWPTSFIEGARPLGKGMKAVGRAVTLNMVPQRPDIAADKPIGVASPEYEAFELCGPKEVLVISSVGPWESVGGDIKFLRLKQLGIAGLVTDGSVRDTDELLSYGFPVFSYSTTPKQGPAAMQPWECNGVISCGGVVVRPGDAIIADQDGAVCVPASHAQQVYDLAHGREEIEEIIKEELVKSARSPRVPTAAAALSRRAAPRAHRPGAAGPLLPVQAADQAGVAARKAAHVEGPQVLLDARRPVLGRPPPHVERSGDDEGGLNARATAAAPPPPLQSTRRLRTRGGTRTGACTSGWMSGPTAAHAPLGRISGREWDT
jgi:regulator of RNase E activity RraA